MWGPAGFRTVEDPSTHHDQDKFVFLELHEFTASNRGQQDINVTDVMVFWNGRGV